MEGPVKFNLGAPSSASDHRSSSIASTPFDPPPRITPPSRIKQIWAVGGGKGGVGKSLLSSSLAISLARMGNKVVAIDLDLGGANLHTALGIEQPRQSIGDFFEHRVKDLENCIIPTGIPHLHLISGAQDSIGITGINVAQKIEFLRKARTMDADYLVLDLGAGTNFNTIDFFLLSDVGLITLLPEPTSIENSYRFIKTAYYRFLLYAPSLSEIKPLIEMAMEAKNPLGIKSPADLFREVNKANPEAGMKLKRQIEKFRPALVVNQTRTQTDIDIGSSVKTVCKKYFGIEMDYIGHLDYDSSVWQSVRRKRPIMLEFPNSRVVSNIEQIAQNIIKRHNQEKNDLFF